MLSRNAIYLVPLIVVVGFGCVELRDRQATAADADALASDVEFGVIATDLVHELQRERGLSSGFVGDPTAAIDVDKPSDHTLVQGILAGH